MGMSVTQTGLAHTKMHMMRFWSKCVTHVEILISRDPHEHSGGQERFRSK